MPQLLKLGGYKSYWFFRGVADWKTPVGVSLGRDRRLADSRLLAAARLRPGLRIAEHAAGVLRLLQGAIRRAGPVCPRARPRGTGRGPTSPSPRNTCRRWSSSSIASRTSRSSCGWPCPAISRPWWPSGRPAGHRRRAESHFSGRLQQPDRIEAAHARARRLLTAAEKLGVLQHWLAIGKGTVPFSLTRKSGQSPRPTTKSSGGRGSRCSSTRRTT